MTISAGYGMHHYSNAKRLSAESHFVCIDGYIFRGKFNYRNSRHESRIRPCLALDNAASRKGGFQNYYWLTLKIECALNTKHRSAATHRKRLVRESDPGESGGLSTSMPLSERLLRPIESISMLTVRKRRRNTLRLAAPEHRSPNHPVAECSRCPYLCCCHVIVR